MKEKEKDIDTDTLCLAQRPAQRKKFSFPGKDEVPEPRPLWRPHGFMGVGGLPRP